MASLKKMTQPMFYERNMLSEELDIELRPSTSMYLVRCGTTVLKTFSQAELCLMRSFLLGGGPGGVNAMPLVKAAQKRSESLATEQRGYMQVMPADSQRREFHIYESCSVAMYLDLSVPGRHDVNGTIRHDTAV